MKTLRGGPTHETLSLLCWDGKRVLLVRNGPGGLFGHAWTLPGGPVEEGEELAPAARRIASGALAIEPSPGSLRVIKRMEPPSPLREERGPDTLVWASSWGGSAQPPNVIAIAPEEMARRRMFREARELIAAACAGLETRLARVPA
jgi:hypothetical protein